jgi:hypothetical protein
LNTAVIRDAIHRIDRWLSDGPAFCPESGAVAGVTDNSGVVYWYGEIAGYYLAYLASLMTQSTGNQKFAPHAARQVGQWLQTQWADGPGPTRLYPGTHVDWRNDYVFAFDLAMILKGLASVRHAGADAWNGRQIAEFIKLNLIDEHGTLRAVSTRTSGHLTNTWATGVDGHQLKAAAGLIAWGTHFKDQSICNLGKYTLRDLTKDSLDDWPHLPLHPRLYALEGLMLCDMANPGSMVIHIQRIVASIDMETERTDVIAQLLRLALFAQIEDRFIDDLASRLLNSIDIDGSVVFQMTQTNGERNTWCAIFARQALYFYDEANCGRKLQHGLCI